MAMVRCEADKHFYDNNKDATCPFCRSPRRSNIDETVGITTNNPTTDSHPHTVAQTVEPDPAAQTVAFWQKVTQFEPVVGWLVCIEGPNKGKDYSIKAGINQIGRDASRDVKIVMTGDLMISRVDHAELEYDDRSNEFYLIRKSNPEVKVNGVKIRQPTLLHSHDLIQLGESNFIFIPLCGEKFRWDIEL